VANSPKKKTRRSGSPARAIEAASTDQKLQAFRRIAAEDLLFLFNEILLPVFPPEYRRFDSVYCYEFADFLARPESNKLIRVSRGFYKSTFLSAYVIQRILNDPNIALSWGHGVKESAIAKSKSIQHHFEHNDRLKAIAPHVCYPAPRTQSPKWTEQKWTIRRTHARPDAPTFFAFGADALPTSLHSDEAVLDDWECDQNSGTPEQVQNTKDKYTSFLPILSSQSRKIVSGTPHAFDGLMESLKKDATFIMFERKCIYPSGPMAGTSLMPDLWPVDRINARVAELGAAVASAQMFLEPLPSEYRLFRKEFFANRRPLADGVRFNRFLYVDPQALENAKGRNAQTGMVSLLWADDRKRYVEDAYGEFLGQMGIMDHIFRHNERDFDFRGCEEGSEGWKACLRDPANHARKRLSGVGIEVNVPLVTELTMLKEQQLRYGRVLFPVHELRHTGGAVDKDARISSLERWYNRGEIVHYPGLENGQLETQLLQHPKSALKDVADAASFAEEYGWYPGAAQAPEPVRTAGELRHRASLVAKLKRKEGGGSIV
jgi:hypothetical protein